MKVRHLMEHLSKMNPDDDICALVYDKTQFDFPDDDDLTLTKEGWEKLCDDFDEQPWSDIWQSLSDGAIHYAEIRGSSTL